MLTPKGRRRSWGRNPAREKGYIDILFQNVEVWGPQFEGFLNEASDFHVVGVAEHRLLKDRLGSILSRHPRFNIYATPATLTGKSEAGTSGGTMAMVQRNLPSAEADRSTMKALFPGMAGQRLSCGSVGVVCFL